MASYDNTRSRIAGGGQPQVTQATIATATNGATYTVDFVSAQQRESEISFVAQGNTAEEIAEELVDAILGDSIAGPIVGGAQALGVASITGQEDGVTFTISSADAKITPILVSQAATDKPDINFGTAVVSTVDADGNEFSSLKSPGAADTEAELLGCCTNSKMIQQDSNGNTAWRGGMEVLYVEGGTIWARLDDNNDDPGAGSEVHFRRVVNAAGQVLGSWRTSADAADTAQVTSGARWLSGARPTGLGFNIAKLQLNLKP